ncbi:MAG: phosphoglycerate kinase [Deltaproteobacteria bacterium]|nr:phosphoglycerate kinase [Deltaproteobacteria bacterium]
MGVAFLKDIELSGRRVLIRADFNVPLKENGKISDDNRIKQFLPTLRYILERKAKPILMSHLGRPGGKPDMALSLRPIAETLSTLLKQDVILAQGIVGQEVEDQVERLQPGQVLLLENLRFNPGEQRNDPEFCQQLARTADVFVNDAFGTSHRPHASIIGVPRLFKQKAAGLLMQKELEYYERALVKPRQPFCMILGGVKVATKLNALIKLADRVDKVIIGGAMANTFLAAQGLQMGRSRFESDLFQRALELIAILARRDCKLYLPVDFMVGPSPNAHGLGRAVPAQEIPADTMALDIGPATSLLFKEALHTAETIVWNGPMGVFENEDFSKGTTDMIEHLSSAHGVTVAGGGDTDAAIHAMQLGHKFNFISTGGGALLQLMEGRGLPGLEVLKS